MLPILHTLTDRVKTHVKVASHHCKQRHNMVISLCSAVVPTVCEGRARSDRRSVLALCTGRGISF